MTKYKAMIFDLDGTLLNSKKDISLATNATIEEMGGKRLAEEEIARYVGRGVRDLIRDALHKVKGTNLEERALTFFKAYYLEHCLDHTRLFKPGEEVLEVLHSKNIKMAVWTNKPQEYTDKILKGLQVEHYFQMILGAEGEYPNKPATEGTNAILNILDVQPHEALMIGDSIVDFQTAENIGMDCALNLNGFSTREEMMALKGQAKYLYEDLGFLLELVQNYPDGQLSN